MISVTFPFCRSRIFSTHEGRDVVRRFFAILQAGNSGAGFSIPHQATRISCPLDTHGDKLSPLGVFQPFPCNSIGGRPRGAWSFVVRCKKNSIFVFCMRLASTPRIITIAVDCWVERVFPSSSRLLSRVPSVLFSMFECRA